jgi:hypothetical protein
MFTLCFAVYASLTSALPTHEVCMLTTGEDVIAQAKECILSRDPISVCDVYHDADRRWTIKRRFMGGA